MTTTITPLERNRVNVVFTMNEGESAKIKDIRIVGNKAFSESTLLGLMDQTTGGWLTWYTKTDRYSRTKLNADLETVRAWYTNRGYLEFEVESTQVTISPDKQDISLTISVREGQPYTVTAVRLEGEYLGRQADFERLVRIKPGDPYRSADVAATTKAFADLYGPVWLRLRAHRGASRDRPRERSGGGWCSRPIPSAASTCAASTSRATTARVTR